MPDESTPPNILRLLDRTPLLWGLALLFYGAGDLLTTVVGLHTGRLIEVGPVAAMVVPYGILPLALLKLFTIGLLVVVWKLIPEPHNLGVPLALITVGVLVTLWNTTMVLSILL